MVYDKTMNSPLGQYAPLVASITVVLLIGAYIFALLFGSEIHVDPANLPGLQVLAIAAVGSVLGSAVAVNGWKAPLNAIHQRLDAAGIPPVSGIVPPTETTDPVAIAGKG